MYWPAEHVEDVVRNHPQPPFMECEYMHDMGNSAGGMGSYIKLLDKYPQYFGGFIWDFIDQALQVKDPISGQMVADRTPKPAMQEVRYYYGLHK